MAYVTKRKSALPDAKQDSEVGRFNTPWSTYGGVGQLQYGSIWYRLAATHGSGPVCVGHACERLSSFRKFFFDHVTKQMVWGHSGGMGHTGTYFCFP